MKRSVQVEIAGQSLSILSDEGPEYVQELADYVDAQIRELSGNRRVSSPQRVALLVAISLADELFREKDLHDRFRSRVEARLMALQEALAAHQEHVDAM